MKEWLKKYLGWLGFLASVLITSIGLYSEFILNIKLNFPEISTTELKKKLESKKRFYLKRRLTAEEKNKLWSLGEKGIITELFQRRVYPHGKLYSHVLGQIDDGNTSVITLKKLKTKFNYNKHTFYRILRFGLIFFNTENNGVRIELTSQNLIIKVVRNNNEKKQVVKKKNNEKKQLKSNNDLIKIVIDYLNEKTTKKFTTKNKQTIVFINARVKDGYAENDFKKVID